MSVLVVYCFRLQVGAGHAASISLVSWVQGFHSLIIDTSRSRVLGDDNSKKWQVL